MTRTKPLRRQQQLRENREQRRVSLNAKVNVSSQSISLKKSEKMKRRLTLVSLKRRSRNQYSQFCCSFQASRSLRTLLKGFYYLFASCRNIRISWYLVHEKEHI